MDSAPELGRAVVALVAPLLGSLFLVRSAYRWVDRTFNP